MRELTIELHYDEGIDPVMDVCIEAPSVCAESIASCVQRDQLWHIERFGGPSQRLDQIEAVRLDDEEDRERMTETECGAAREHEVIERSPTTLAVYTFVTRLHTSNSVLALAARHLDHGIVFQSRRRGCVHRWRCLLRSEENVDVFYGSVEDHLRDGISMSMQRLGTVQQVDYDSLAAVSIPRKQRETLWAAIERGYYETPRGITIDKLADRLGSPPSTVSYRLRQAEACLAKGYFHRFRDPGDVT
ncbi:helix-turn-helix domain-containing protein [Halobellus captivus]|uniref:helix-turn-helix domain-containing protein n=1 Tax=Halobellus captivus TaxID=2592614 RepID=UPI00119EF0E2|nr:helix-turn-helix domain-containing protein [Halobellus captivus]